MSDQQTSLRHLKALLADTSPGGRQRLFWEICRLLIDNPERLTAKQQETVLDLIRTLMPDIKTGLKKRVVRLLLERPEALPDLTRLFIRERARISAPLIGEAVNLNERDLLYIAEHGSRKQRLALCTRKNLPALVMKILLRQDDPEIDTLLSGQPPPAVEAVSAGESAIDAQPEAETAKPDQTLEAPTTMIGRAETAPSPHLEIPRGNVAQSTAAKAHATQNIRGFNTEGKVFAAADLLVGEANVTVEFDRARQMRQRFEDYTRAISDWFWELDANGCLSFMSERVVTVFGQPAQRMLGLLLDDIGQFRDAKGTAISCDDLIGRHLPFRDCRFEVRDLSGNSTAWNLNGVAVFDDKTGKFLGYRGTAQEAEGTSYANSESEERVPMPMKTNLHNPQAAEAGQYINATNDTSINERLQNMSHELRTPLNAIIGFSDMIRTAIIGPLDQRYRQSASHIHEAAGTLNSLIQDVLDSAQISSGHLELDRESFVLEDVMAAAVRAVKHRVTSANPIVAEIRAEETPLHGDKYRTQQILERVLEAALRLAYPGQPVTIRARTTETACIDLTISTLGFQIETLSQVIEAHNAAGVEERQHLAGISTGVYLSFAQQLAKTMGGSIAFHSGENQEQIFVVRLPEG